MNKVFITALTAIGVAQLLKVQINKMNTGVLDWKGLFSTGGMPSSHAAAVTSLATYIGLQKGWRSIDFSLSTIFGLIVMYDAMGIRRHAGEIAMEVNELEEHVERLAYEHYPGDYYRKREDDLKEMLGHLPIEVAGGAIVGSGLGGLGYWLFRSLK